MPGERWYAGPIDDTIAGMREVSLAVVGLDFPNEDRSKSNRRFEVALCAPGEEVQLVPEPKNKHDRRAVAVFSCRGIQLGYLTAERCGWIGGRLANGEEYVAVFQEARASAAIIRVRFGGGHPTIPAAAPSRPAPGHFADEYVHEIDDTDYPDPPSPWDD